MISEQTQQKKYEILQDDKIEHLGKTLYRIKALINFGSVVAGSLGGYIEKASNLDQTDNAWVSDNAMVSDNARIYGDAMVSDDALVYGNARVYGNAMVYGDALVSDNVRVFDNALVSGKNMIFLASNVGTENGTLTVFNGKDGLIVTRGCFIGSVDEFLAKSAEVHDDKTKREYQLLIEVAKSRILGE